MMVSPTLQSTTLAYRGTQNRNVQRFATRLQRWLGLLLVVLFLVEPASAEVQLIPTVDEGRIDQPFELVIEAAQHQSVTGSPDLSALKQDFRILSNRSVYLTEKRTGRTVYISRWTLRLSPIRSGTLTIPAIRVKGEWSQPLQFQVHPKPRPKAKPLQLKTTLSHTEAYLGSPLTLSVQLFYNIALQSAELTQPMIEGVRILRQGEQRIYSQVINQQRYQVIEQLYWLQPLNPGRFQIPSLQFNAIDSLGKPLNGQSKTLDLAISVLPDNLSSQIQLLAKQVKLRQQWQTNHTTARAGDTLTRTITLEAQGIPAQWLPDIELPSVEGISVYPQPAKFEQIDNNGVLTSRKQVDFKLLLTQPGHFELPSVALQWWDTDNGLTATASLEPMPLQVAPFNATIDADTGSRIETPARVEATATTQAQTAPMPSTTAPREQDIQWQAWIWALIALVCAVGWTLSQQRNKKLEAQLGRSAPGKAKRTTTAAAKTSAASIVNTDPVLSKQSAEQPGTSAVLRNSFDELAEACHLNDPELAYERLFDWAEVHWPQAMIESLEDIQRLAKDPTLTYLLKNLEHQLQDPSDSWHGDLMLERIGRLRQHTRRQPLRHSAESEAPPQLSGGTTPPPSVQPQHDKPASDRPARRTPFRTTVGD